MSSIANRFNMYIVPKVAYPSALELKQVSLHLIHDELQKPMVVNVSEVTVCFLGNEELRGVSFDFINRDHAEVSALPNIEEYTEELLKREEPRKVYSCADVIRIAAARGVSLREFFKGKEGLITGDHIGHFLKGLHDLYVDGSVTNHYRQHWTDVIIREYC